MEAKLKSQRVADLRELLQKAAVPIPAKANKADLIAKILASPAAIDAYNNRGNSPPSAAAVQKPKAPESSHVGQDDDLLAPPEEFDWGPSNGVQAPPPVPTESAPQAGSNITTTPSITVKESGIEKSTKMSTAPSVSTYTTESAKDDELEKRKKRAARFGIPLVETKVKGVPPSKGTKAAKEAPKSQNVPVEEAAKIAARAARFGNTQVSTGVTNAPTADIATTGSPNTKRKRSPAPVDNEEMERRKKRAERFSIGKEANAQT